MKTIKIILVAITISFQFITSVNAQQELKPKSFPKSFPKRFIDNVQLTVQAGTAIGWYRSDEGKFNFNAYGLYNIDDYLKAGIGYQRTKYYTENFNSIYLTGMVQAQGRIYKPYARISAGMDYYDKGGFYSPGFYAGISAGVNCMTVKNLAFNIEAGLKSYNFHYGDDVKFELTNEYGQSIGTYYFYGNANNSYSLVDISLGLSYSFGK